MEFTSIARAAGAIPLVMVIAVGFQLNFMEPEQWPFGAKGTEIFVAVSLVLALAPIVFMSMVL